MLCAAQRTTVVTRSMAKSMSASVVVRPRPKRIDGAGAIADGADRLEHVRRGLAAGTAGRAGRHGEIAERHQQRLAFDIVEADVEVVRQAAVGRGTVDPHAVEPRAEGRRAADRAARRAAPLRRHLLAADLRGAAKPTMPGTFSVPERRPFSCPPPSIWHGERQLRLAAAHVERAGALGAVALVRRSATGDRSPSGHVERESCPRPARHRCERATPRCLRDGADLAERLQHADLVVGRHDRDEDRAFGDRRAQLVEIDEALARRPPSLVTRQPSRSSRLHESSTDLCSVATVMM